MKRNNKSTLFSYVRKDSRYMFLEQAFTSSGRRGWIEIITGSMFSGKTEELIRRLRRASLARQQVEIFKPQVDDRYDPNRVVSHDANAIPSRAVTSSSDILTFSEKMDVIGIDEVQFFDKKITSVCNELANRGIRVVVAGLDMDYRGMPFAPVSDLMAIAEYVTKLHAICIRCGHLAHHSHRTTEENARVVLGEKNKYEPLCRDCFNKRQASDL